MAQFDVHRNPGRTRIAIPFVVVVQSRAYDKAVATRLVEPLYLAAELPKSLSSSWDRELAPRFVVGGTEVIFNPLAMTAMLADLLGAPFASLAGDESSDAILAAIDRAVTRAFG